MADRAVISTEGSRVPIQVAPPAHDMVAPPLMIYS